MKTKLKIIIPSAIAVIAIIIAAVCIKFTPTKTVDISSLVSTAQKYLIENNYEQAIAEFEKIIDLDPRNVDAYIGIAEAYEGMGDTDKAIEWLEKGYELTEDERLKQILDEFIDSRESEAEETIAVATTTAISTNIGNAEPNEFDKIKEEALSIMGLFTPDKPMGEPYSSLFAYITVEYEDNRIPTRQIIFKCEYDENGKISKKITKEPDYEDEVFRVLDYSIGRTIWTSDSLSYYQENEIDSASHVYNDLINCNKFLKDGDTYVFNCANYDINIYIVNNEITGIECNYFVNSTAGKIYSDCFNWKFVYNSDAEGWSAIMGDEQAWNVSIYMPYIDGFPNGYNESRFGTPQIHPHIYESYDDYKSTW